MVLSPNAAAFGIAEEPLVLTGVGMCPPTRVRTNQIKLPDIPPAQQNPFGGPSVSHGIAVTFGDLSMRGETRRHRRRMGFGGKQRPTQSPGPPNWRTLP